MTPEQRLLEDLKNIVGGSATKLASARGQELSQDVPGLEKVASLAEMSIEDIMRDPNFVAGLNYELDKLAAEWVPAAKDILEKTAATKEKKKERKSHEEGETKFPSRWRSFARGAQIGGLGGAGLMGAQGALLGSSYGPKQAIPGALAGATVGGLGGALTGGIGGLMARHVVRPEKTKKKD